MHPHYFLLVFDVNNHNEIDKIKAYVMDNCHPACLYWRVRHEVNERAYEESEGKYNLFYLHPNRDLIKLDIVIVTRTFIDLSTVYESVACNSCEFELRILDAVSVNAVLRDRNWKHC
jgi:hypothetical protein